MSLRSANCQSHQWKLHGIWWVWGFKVVSASLRKKSDNICRSRSTVFVPWRRSKKIIFSCERDRTGGICRATFAARQSCSVLHSAVRHSVDAPLGRLHERFAKKQFCRCQQWLLTYLHIEMVVTSDCVLSVLVTSFTYLNTKIYFKKGFFCRRFRRSEGLLQNNFLQIKVKDDLQFLLAQITLKYSKKWCETVSMPWVFARWAHADHPPLATCHQRENQLSINRKMVFARQSCNGLQPRLNGHRFCRLSPSPNEQIFPSF